MIYYFFLFLFSVFFICSYKRCNWLARVSCFSVILSLIALSIILLVVPSLLCVRFLCRPCLAVCTQRACLCLYNEEFARTLCTKDFVGVDGQKDLLMRTTSSGVSRAVQCVIPYTKNWSTAVLTVGINTHYLRNKSRVRKIYQVCLVCVSFCNHRERRSQAFGRRKTINNYCGGWQRVPASN